MLRSTRSDETLGFGSTATTKQYYSSSTISPLTVQSPTELNKDALPIVNLLIDRGADPNIRGRPAWVSTNELCWVFIRISTVSTSRREDDTALHAACASRRPDLVLALLNNKANPNITGESRLAGAP